MSPKARPQTSPALATTRWRDGVMPKELPLRGEDLMPGYQYELDPAARRAIDERFGVRGVPTYVECIKKRCAPCVRETRVTNLETGAVHESRIEEPEQPATFRAYLGGTRLAVFTLDLPALQRARAAMTPAELVRDDRYERTDERPESRKAKPAKQVIDIDSLFLPCL